MSDRDDSQQAEAPRPNPVTELVIRKERLADGYSELLVRIDPNGDLILDGADAGELVRQHWGDWDYEYTQTVPAKWRDTVLLHLIKGRFTNTSDFRTWCAERGIPTEFWSYA